MDSNCGIEGDATTDAKKLESRVKNNLCATGSPVWVTFVSFKKLQDAVEKPGFKLKDDRSGAKNLHTTNPAGDAIGEGTRVTFAAFVLRADTSNKSGGETVNCTRNGTPSNDIHVHLGPTKTKSPENFCKAVVAELIPHLRPDAFNAGDLALTNNIPSQAHPVRVTGQLFFDSHHGVTCDLDKPQNSKASKWEIHAVYKVEVCKHKSLTTCAHATTPNGRTSARGLRLKKRKIQIPETSTIAKVKTHQLSYGRPQRGEAGKSKLALRNTSLCSASRG